MTSPPGELLEVAGPTESAAAASSRIAQELKSAVAQRGHAAIALSGGNTPRGAYARLAHEAGVHWEKVDILWVDERAVPPADDRSNYRWAKAALLDAVPAAASRAARMEAERPDLEGAARDYEAVLRARVAEGAQGVPALDVIVLGVGDDGHTASLFPGDATVDIRDRLVVAVPPGPGREARLTLTVPVIQQARCVLVLALGEGKREPLRRVWADDGDLHATPARIIRGCRGEVVWIVDAAALHP